MTPSCSEDLEHTGTRSICNYTTRHKILPTALLHIVLHCTVRLSVCLSVTFKTRPLQRILRYNQQREEGGGEKLRGEEEKGGGINDHSLALLVSVGWCSLSVHGSSLFFWRIDCGLQ